jgi:PII-like signaling protein
VAVVDALHSSGLAGASVLLGLDGHVGGVRRRATFLGSNAEVPLMVLSVGSGESVVWALALLEAMDCETTVTLERVRVCRRDGVAVGEPHGDPSAGAEAWQKLTVYASEQSTHAGQPLQATLVRRLRREGAAGATVLRGIWGYHGDHEPHGERFWSLRRHVPSIAVVLDTAANMGRWFEIVAELTGETGLVTSEVVPWHLDGTDSAGNVA